MEGKKKGPGHRRTPTGVSSNLGAAASKSLKLFKGDAGY